MNSVALVGRLVKNPDVKVFPTNQTTVARFCIAINRGKDKDGKDLGADYPNIVAFGKKAEVVEKYFKKGNMIALTGKLHTDSYEKDGKKIYTTDVVMESFTFVEKKAEEQSPVSNTDNPFDEVPGFSKISGEDIPF